jgi:transposase
VPRKVGKMGSSKNTKILTEVLNLEGVRVISSEKYLGIGRLLQVESTEKVKKCPRCGKASRRVHQNHRYVVKDLPWGEETIFLEINRRQFKCERCKKPFSEELDFIRRRRKYTKRLAKKTVEEVKEKNINTVAKKGVVTTEEIERMLKDAAAELEVLKPDNLKKLGIDEIALKKGKGNYCAVLVDIEKSLLLEILPGRSQAEIKETLMKWGSEVLEQIEEVSIDLWKGYKNVVRELMPNAQVVADRFHVMTQINQELDKERKRELDQAKKEKKAAKTASSKEETVRKLEGLKNSKYALLKNEENLNQKQKEKLAEVFIVSPKLQKMHQLKEQIRRFFNESQDWWMGIGKLGKWLSKAKEYFPTSYQTIVRWLDEILAYFDHRTTQGVVEGINNKLKLIKRSAYGFRNFRNFQTRALLNWHSSS